MVTIFAIRYYCRNIIYLNMGVVRSMGVGKTRGSVGNMTYRVVRGRTISSERITERPATRGIGSGSVQNALFGMVAMYADAHATDIQVSFNKTQYGSQRNYFMKLNFGALRTALLSLASTAKLNGFLPTIDAIESAVSDYATANPTKIIRVKLAGFEKKFLTGPWSSEDNPVSGGSVDSLGAGVVRVTASAGEYNAPCAFSLNYHSGALITRPAGSVAIQGAAITGVPASIVYLGANGTPLASQPTISGKAFVSGVLNYSVTAITGATAVKLDDVYLRLTSAYVFTEADDTAG